MIDIIIVRSNSVIYDYPVERLVRSLSKKYSVLVLGWNRDGVSKKLIEDYMVDLKLCNLRAPIGKPGLVLYYPLFWIWVVIKLMANRPRVAHSIDLDTVIPCYIYKSILGKKMVFNVFDRYAMVNIPRKFSFLYSIVNLLEELFAKKSNVLITIGEKLLDTFQRRPKDCSIIMNLPEEHVVEKVPNESENPLFRVVTTGPIVRTRGFKNIVAAIENLNDVEFVFAGRVLDMELIGQVLKQFNVKYEGLLQTSDALALEAHSDAMIVLYDLRVPINNYALPCKLFEAMMFGRPLITNLAPELVSKIGCGILVDYDNIDQIIFAITSLRDDAELRHKLGNNGRKAFLQKYNWARMEQELYKIHDSLLGKSMQAESLLQKE